MRKNVLANYLSQVYATLIGVLMLPIYIRYMGNEAYGLIGFFAMLQAWFLLLDLGLTPTMARETARYQGGASNPLELRELLRSLEVLFLFLALLGGACLIIGAEWIASKWLNLDRLEINEVASAIRIMALGIVLRWMCELYRAVISGFEKMVWLGAFNSAIATARFVLVIPFFVWVGSSVEQFFIFQLAVTVIEFLLISNKAYDLMPVAPDGKTKWSILPPRNILKFSLVMALASAVWIAVSQTDKLLLSGMLSLSDYGWFSLAVLAANSVLLLTTPIVAALMPRMSALDTKDNDAELLHLYREGTQWVGIVAWSVCGVLAFHAERILLIWTGNERLAAQAAITMSLYALGNAVMAVGALPFYLQFAKGQLRLHLLGTGLFVLVLLPSLVWAVDTHGAVGAGWVWLIVNSLYFLFWIPVAHNRFAPGLHIHWLLRDVAPTALLATISALASSWLPWTNARMPAGFQILAVSLGILIASAMGSPWARAQFSRLLRDPSFRRLT